VRTEGVVASVECPPGSRWFGYGCGYRQGSARPLIPVFPFCAEDFRGWRRRRLASKGFAGLRSPSARREIGVAKGRDVCSPRSGHGGRGSKMNFRRARATVLAIAVLGSGCGDGAGPSESIVPTTTAGAPSPVGMESPDASLASVQPGEVLLTGGLLLVGVCPVLSVADSDSTASPPTGKAYELVLPDGWDFGGPAPESIRDQAGNVVARVGDRVTVRGRLGEPIGTFCAVGEGLEVIDISVEG